MSELDIIKKTKTPNTVESLIRDFHKLGLKYKDTVLVHSSLFSIGWVCGEENAVIQALLQTVGKEGTICMPAHSGGSDPAEWKNPPVPKEWNEIIYKNMPAFSPAITPTRGMGRIAELFRKYPGTLRSYHPHTSFCANGKNAKEITENHALTPQFGMESPLGKLYKLNAKVLLLGVNYNSCTSFHMGEVLNGNIAKVQAGAAMEINHIREWVWFKDYDYNCDDFDKLGKDLERQGQVVTGNVGNAVCKFFDIKSGVDFSAKWLKENRG